MISHNYVNDFDLSSNFSFQSSSSCCSYQLQSISSSTPDINISSNTILETYGASNLWIMELRWHIESECSNILQSKVIPDIYCKSATSKKNKPPLSLSADILEDKFAVIADCFQSIFRNSQNTKNESFFITTAEKLSKIINIIHDMLSLMRGDEISKDEADGTILLELTKIKLRVEKDLLVPDSRINLKTLLSNLIEYGRILANLKQFLIKFIIETFLGYINKQVRKRLFRNSSIANDIMNDKQKVKFEDSRNHYNEKIKQLVSTVIKMIKRSKIYSTAIIEAKGLKPLIKMCSLSYFKRNWLLTLKLFSMLCINEDSILQFEKNNGIDIVCSLMRNFSATEAVLVESARLIAQITFVKISSFNICSSRTPAHVDKLQSNLDKLLNSLTMMCAITMSSSTFIAATVAINNLMLLFPKVSTIALHPRLIQILVYACLSDKAFSNLAKENVVTIFANLSANYEFERLLIDNNVVELSLQFLSEFIMESMGHNCYYGNNKKKSSLINHPNQNLKRFDFLLCLFNIIINLCCNERNIDILVENNDVGNLYVFHRRILSLHRSKTELADECLLLLESIIKCMEARTDPHSSKTVQAFLNLNNAKESDV